jgi:hypothetical protein
MQYNSATKIKTKQSRSKLWSVAENAYEQVTVFRVMDNTSNDINFVGSRSVWRSFACELFDWIFRTFSDWTVEIVCCRFASSRDIYAEQSAVLRGNGTSELSRPEWSHCVA